jgi:coproporphyrinogen III oxidase-like Fe-S oxidoreductase
VGQVGNLQRIVNPPAGSEHNAGESPEKFAAFRYVGQAIQPALAEERFFVGLRLTEGIRPEPEEWQKFAAPIRRFVDAGLLETAGGVLRLTNRGVMLSNEVFQEFLTA